MNVQNYSSNPVSNKSCIICCAMHRCRLRTEGRHPIVSLRYIPPLIHAGGPAAGQPAPATAHHAPQQHRTRPLATLHRQRLRPSPNSGPSGVHQPRPQATRHHFGIASHRLLHDIGALSARHPWQRHPTAFQGEGGQQHRQGDAHREGSRLFRTKPKNDLLENLPVAGLLGYNASRAPPGADSAAYRSYARLSLNADW